MVSEGGPRGALAPLSPNDLDVVRVPGCWCSCNISYIIYDLQFSTTVVYCVIALHIWIFRIWSAIGRMDYRCYQHLEEST